MSFDILYFHYHLIQIFFNFYRGRFFLILTRGHFVIIFRQRKGGGRERKREILMRERNTDWLPSHMPLNQGSNVQPGYVPDPSSCGPKSHEPMTFWSTG